MAVQFMAMVINIEYSDKFKIKYHIRVVING